VSVASLGGRYAPYCLPEQICWRLPRRFHEYLRQAREVALDIRQILRKRHFERLFDASVSSEPIKSLSVVYDLREGRHSDDGC